MPDHTEEENLNNPPATPSENEAEEVAPQVETQITNASQEENMEVHHHAHHEGKKNWRSYFWEFLMLFLAVFCGFLAEYKLEHVIEHQREEVYVQSMIEDTKTDRANIKVSIASNTDRMYHLDTLANLCINYTGTLAEDSAIYFQYVHGILHPSFVSPTERTMLQLKNAGGMRLIRNKTAADSIILYDDMAKRLLDQQVYYELYQNNSMNLAVKFINFQKFGIGVTDLGPEVAVKTKEYFKLLSNDKMKLVEFGNIILIYEGVAHYYIMLLEEMNEHAINLEHTLKKEYHIE